MPRSISSNALAKLATQYGTEPIVVVEIWWNDNHPVIGRAPGSPPPDYPQPRMLYADRDIPGLNIKGKIIEIGGLDDVVNVSGGSQSQQIALTLDDTDGTIKKIVDANDVHLRPVWVYQWFEGLDFGERFLLFKGEINTPLEWDEGDRTLKMDVVSKVEDVEVGFSIEEGFFPKAPENLIGKPWPLAFGTVINLPALQTKAALQGTLAQGTGIKDFTLAHRMQLAANIVCPLVFTGWTLLPPTLGERLRANFVNDASCVQQRCQAVEELALEYKEQSSYEISPVKIFGGEKFPQEKTITIAINSGKFIGQFKGDLFYITGRIHPQDDGTGKVKQPETPRQIGSVCGPAAFSVIREGSPEDQEQNFHPEPGSSEAGARAQLAIWLSNKQSRQTWAIFNAAQKAGFFWANAGDTVTLAEQQEIVYICNLLPSTVLRVAAWRELRGGRQLLTVPTTYYSVRISDFHGYRVTEVVFPQPLTSRDLETGGGWSDEIFVSLTSPVGPNTVDILKWFITTYTKYKVDNASFNYVKGRVDNYPMHFALLDRKDIHTVLQEMAYQARCALWMKDDTFYIKYLPEEPDADETVNETDVLINSLKLTHSPTEDLVTKYTAEWTENYANDKKNKIILRHNVKKYGTHEEVYDYYCYNIYELVRKSATFWMIRKANTWRRAIFKTPLSKLKLECLDTVALTLPDIADGTVKGIVEKANYNSDDHSIDFEVWLPIKSGSRTPYNFAWPADIDEHDLFPTLEERELGLGGSGTEPNFSTIAPPGHPLANPSPTGGSISYDCASYAFLGDVPHDTSSNCRPDQGDSEPSDEGDEKPEPKVPNGWGGEINTGTSPVTIQNPYATNPWNPDSPEQKSDRAEQIGRNAQEEANNDYDPDKDYDPDAEEEDPNDPDKPYENLPHTCGGDGTVTVFAERDRIQNGYNRDGERVVLEDDEYPPDQSICMPYNWAILGQVCYTFNSLVAAQEFVDKKKAEHDALLQGCGYEKGMEVEGFWTIVINGTVKEPPADQRGMTAQKFTPNAVTP